jgi:hypothetical protein
MQSISYFDVVHILVHYTGETLLDLPLGGWCIVAQNRYFCGAKMASVAYTALPFSVSLGTGAKMKWRSRFLSM